MDLFIVLLILHVLWKLTWMVCPVDYPSLLIRRSSNNLSSRNHWKKQLHQGQQQNSALRIMRHDKNEKCSAAHPVVQKLIQATRRIDVVSIVVLFLSNIIWNNDIQESNISFQVANWRKVVILVGYEKKKNVKTVWKVQQRFEPNNKLLLLHLHIYYFKLIQHLDLNTHSVKVHLDGIRSCRNNKLL